MCLCPLKRMVSGELENHGSKGDLDSERTEAKDRPHGLLAAPQSFSAGQLLVSSLELPGVKIVGGEMELPRKYIFF